MDAEEDRRHSGFEARDARIGRVLWVGGGLLGALLLCLAAVAAQLYLYQRGEAPQRLTPLEREALRQPEPRLEVDPAAAAAGIQARGRARLGEYAWIDRAQGVVRIPIDEAMAQLAAEGWPREGRDD